MGFIFLCISIFAFLAIYSLVHHYSTILSFSHISSFHKSRRPLLTVDMLFRLLLALSAVPALVAAQSVELAGKVGPKTSIASKKAIKTCDITTYGAKADGKTDISSALTQAFTACKSGGVVVIPSGDYALSTWVTLSGGKAWALQLDGTIYRTGTAGGNMIFIEHGNDFELFSSTGKGVIQGYGYEFHKDGNTKGPRILRLYEMTDFSIHDVILVDSPLFHLSLDTCDSGEVYNMVVRGGNSGGLDGIDIWSTNIWVHDVEVTNKVSKYETFTYSRSSR